MSGWFIVIVTLVLLGANAFFVGAEFAAMSARRSQLEPLADAGSKRAAVALQAMHRTGLLLATAQLGITVCSVLLGAVSEAALHHALVPVTEALGLSEVVADAVALVIALAIVVFLHVVYGEMIPKNISIARPERSAVALVPALVMVSRVLAPVIHAMDWLAKAGIRLFGVEPKDEVASAFTAEEVAHILDESRDEGLVERRALRTARCRPGVQRQGRRRRRRAAGRAGHRHQRRDPARHRAARRQARLLPLPGASTTSATSGATCTSRTCSTPTRSSGSSRCRPSGCAGWPTSAATTRSSRCCRPCRSPGRTWPAWSPRTARWSGVVFLEDVIEELVGEVSDSSQR